MLLQLPQLELQEKQMNLCLILMNEELQGIQAFYRPEFLTIFQLLTWQFLGYEFVLEYLIAS